MTPANSQHTALRIISAGAAKGLITDLQEPFARTSPHIQLSFDNSFGAVGAMKDIFKAEVLTLAAEDLAGVVMISSESILNDLIKEGLLDSASYTPIGWVSTAVARLEGDDSIQALPKEEDLQHALLHAPVIYAPDTEKSTAGIHFKKVLMALELWVPLKDRIQNFPNGAAAMGQMAKDHIKGALGCTQVTEINYTPGVEVISLLPKRFELNTLYSAASALRGHQATLANDFIRFLCGDSPAKEARLSGGFFDL